MNTILFTSRWSKQRWAAIMEENTKKNTEFYYSNALQFYFGTIIKKRQYELTPELVEIYSKYTIVDKNDIIINGLNLNYDFISQRVGIVKEQGIITSAYLSMRIRPDYNPYYYCYLLKAMDARKVFHGMGTGIRLTLSYKELRNILLPVPSRDEQDLIVRFLDWKVSCINKLIINKKKEIHSIEAIKQSVVSDAITHGLDPTVPMKYSGVRWLGNIPAHWAIVKLRQILHPVSLKNHSELPLLSVVREQGVVLRDPEDKEANHNFIPDDLSNYKVVKKGQFAMNKMKAWQGSYGISAYTGIVSPAYFIFDVDFENLEYFHYAIRSKVYVNFFAQASDGIRVGQWDLQMDKMKEIPFIVPSPSEQTKIVAHIKTMLPKYDRAIETLMAAIEKLEEYKTKLISDVVTGKIDVRGNKILDYEYVEEEADEESSAESEEKTQDVLGEV